MAIRAFLSTWSVSGWNNGVRYVTNPIYDYVRGNGTPVRCQMFYPDADVDGLPDKNRVLVFLISNTLTATQLEAAKNLTGVSLIPPYPLATILSNIPTATRAAMLDIVTNNGIPTDEITLASTYKETLELIITYFIPSFPGLDNIADDF